MIRVKDVVRVKMPYPNINSELAASAHMYICKKSGTEKDFLKIQTKKNKHRIHGIPIDNYFELEGNSNDNPCKHDSFVDLEKNFNLKGVKIPIWLKTDRDLKQAIYNDIINRENILEFVPINTNNFLNLNYACSRY